MDLYILIAVTVAAAVLCAASLIFAFVTRRNTARTIAGIEDMIDRASEGEFRPADYTESEISALECRFADFLSSSLTTEAGLAEEKDRIKAMISDISHQTKTPVANLLLYSELLGEDEGLSPQGRESVEMIHTQTEKLRFLIDSLVKLSRLESGVVSPEPKRDSVRDLAEQAVSELSAKAAEKGLQLKGPDPGFDIEAVFDMKWTREALVNIIDNAIKYTDSGYVEVSIGKTDVFARIDVKDTGIGISEEESAKVYQRFYRSSEVASQEGIGIGLYLAREILSDEGGYIKLKSKKGEGTTFSLFLPVN
ncbi:MAG TPA: two-component sensor histidine kinase [Clostridiales bacterium]|nr:two-component sensor histidine kinase [Clostridiales bacterium]